MDWDDVRVVPCVAERLDARRRAGARAEPATNRPPNGRIRATFRGRLVRSLPEGLRLQRRGEQLVPEAESVEDAVLTWSGARRGLAGVERHGAGIDRRGAAGFWPAVCRIPNDGAAVRITFGTGLCATGGKPRTTRSRYGVAPPAAGKR